MITVAGWYIELVLLMEVPKCLSQGTFRKAHRSSVPLAEHFIRNFPRVKPISQNAWSACKPWTSEIQPTFRFTDPFSDLKMPEPAANLSRAGEKPGWYR